MGDLAREADVDVPTVRLAAAVVGRVLLAGADSAEVDRWLIATGLGRRLEVFRSEVGGTEVVDHGQ